MLFTIQLHMIIIDYEQQQLVLYIRLGLYWSSDQTDVARARPDPYGYNLLDIFTRVHRSWLGDVDLYSGEEFS